MSPRTREWLRSFLRLGARSEGTLLDRDVVRQEDTVLRALTLLDAQPGVVLADEVGMGKTYEALGVIAARIHENPDARVLILTPGPNLTTKWHKELASFCDTARPMYAGFRDKFTEVTTLGELVDPDTKPIRVASVTLFGGPRALADKAYLLSAWAEVRGLAGNQVAAVFRHYGKGARVDLESSLFLGTLDWSVVRGPLKRALGSGKRKTSGLDALWDTHGYDGFQDANAVDAALTDLRFRVLAELVQRVDLLVVDEAHKLKNPESVRATGVRTVFDRKFAKALFLTATPFQLSVDELRQVFQLFARAHTAPNDTEERADLLLEHIGEYQRAYGAFEAAWSRSDPTHAEALAAWFARDRELATPPDDASLRVLGRHARELLRLKREVVEPELRRWMIRSLREDKRTYRKANRHTLKAAGGPGVPFVLYERFIAELFRSKSRTHKAAVQINMVSSFAAARTGALMNDEVKTNLAPEAEGYRKLLQTVLASPHFRDGEGGHPKVDFVVRECVEAAERGEKTLVFCARVETLHELRSRIAKEWDERIVARWRRVYPDATVDDVFDRTEDGERARGRHSVLRARFKAPRSPLYLALRERYVPTMLRASDFAERHMASVVARANAILSTLRVNDPTEVDWALAKRCVERATAHLLIEAGEADNVSPDALRRLTHADFVPWGYDLERDALEAVNVGSHAPRWTIDEEGASSIVRPNLWSYVTGQLEEIPATLRVSTVERLATYLTSRYVPFFAELVGFAVERGLDREHVRARDLLPLVDQFWTGEGRRWVEVIRQFLGYALHVTNRDEVLQEVVRAGAVVRHTISGENREMLREAFNTPLYPMVLLANEVMQEGLDLHHHCRRVIHHDLAWNPAQLEQRVGRVDRLGSLVQRLRVKAPQTTLDIELPLVRNTIDERLERTVRHRERWLEFLLGAAPKFEEYGLADDPILPLPANFADALRVELGPG